MLSPVQLPAHQAVKFRDDACRVVQTNPRVEGEPAPCPLAKTVSQDA